MGVVLRREPDPTDGEGLTSRRLSNKATSVYVRHSTVTQGMVFVDSSTFFSSAILRGNNRDYLLSSSSLFFSLSLSPVHVVLFHPQCSSFSSAVTCRHITRWDSTVPASIWFIFPGFMGIGKMNPWVLKGDPKTKPRHILHSLLHFQVRQIWWLWNHWCITDIVYHVFKKPAYHRIKW